MKANIWAALGLGLAGLFLSGCGTLCTLNHNAHEAGSLYNGTRFDALGLGVCVVGSYEEPKFLPIGLLVSPFILGDLPLSVVGDTVVLPFIYPYNVAAQPASAPAAGNN